MNSPRQFVLPLATGLLALAVLVAPVVADQFTGTVKSVDEIENELIVLDPKTDKNYQIQVLPATKITKEGMKTELKKLMKGDEVDIQHERGVAAEIKVKSKKMKKVEEAEKRLEEAQKKLEQAQKEVEDAKKKVEEAKKEAEEAKKEDEPNKENEPKTKG